MKNRLIFLLFGFLILTIISCNEGKSKFFPSGEEVAAIMNNELKNSDLLAVVAIAVNKNSERVTYKYGKAIWSVNNKVTPENIFRIWSMTKLVTSIAAMQCMENGLIGLDEDLSSIMPEMTNIPIFHNGELIKPKNKITLRHLLTHTSGFGYTGFTAKLDSFDNENWNYDDDPRHFESGTEFLYGTSTDWVGKLVEKLTDMTLEEYFRKNITEPLGMNRTFFNVPDSLHYAIVSWGERGADGNQKLEESPERIPKKVISFSGGGGLFSTPSDYTKLLQCILNMGKYEDVRLLQKETITEMIKNQIGDISIDPRGRYFNPGTCCNFNELLYENSKWGLAFAIDNNHKDYGRKEGTVHWGGYMNTYFFIDFKSGIAASIYSQHIPFNHFATKALFEKFSEIIYEKYY